MAKIKKGDLVKVVKGRAKNQVSKSGESAGSTAGVGKVLKIDSANGKVWVEGLNIVKKHKKPDANNQQGRIVEVEAAMDISNVQIYDAAAKKVSRVGYKVLEDGTKVRIIKSSGKELE